ncbi:hypothetical protein AXF42_Ash015810 [Apostasia shenzhenica]|uniref:DUF7733 domain-containing protein n=1 Tax=Apostasia shenzhenica TaxID=1088818 RepID=A0A2H9ZXP4_9ASPA|nr:hypothetical protein AXF42_Ash015810 [Apostasia shenzhenica]
MSGGIGATANEISLPSDGGGGGGIPLTSHTASGIFTSFRQLNALVLAVVFAASGMVSVGELAFAVFSLPYVLFLSRAAFPPHTGDDSPIFSPKNRLIGIHITVGALLGLFLPVAYILEGVIEGDRELPIRVLALVSYNARRMLTLADWAMDEMDKNAAAGSTRGSDLRRFAGLGLAVANLIFWGTYLFELLLPVYLPLVLSRYYAYKEK